MRCPACHTEKTNEYFHVLSLDPNKESYRFNYCCSECLAERLRVPRHIKFEFLDRDREEIRAIAREEQIGFMHAYIDEFSKGIEHIIREIVRDEISKVTDVKKRLGIARKMDGMF